MNAYAPIAPLDELQTLLADGFSVSMPAHSPTSPISLSLAKLRQMRQRRSAGSASPQMTAALYQLRLGSMPTEIAGLRKLCAGLCRAGGWEQRRPIDDPQLVAELLRCVDALVPHPHRFSRCYRALLTSYFALPAADAMVRHGGWRVLGDFLRRSFAQGCPPQARTGWQVLLRHCAALLEPDARAAAVSPEIRLLLCLRLGVPPGGWLDQGRN